MHPVLTELACHQMLISLFHAMVKVSVQRGSMSVGPTGKLSHLAWSPLQTCQHYQTVVLRVVAISVASCRFYQLASPCASDCPKKSQDL